MSGCMEMQMVSVSRDSSELAYHARIAPPDSINLLSIGISERFDRLVYREVPETFCCKAVTACPGELVTVIRACTAPAAANDGVVQPVVGKAELPQPPVGTDQQAKAGFPDEAVEAVAEPPGELLPQRPMRRVDTKGHVLVLFAELSVIREGVIIQLSFTRHIQCPP